MNNSILKRIHRAIRDGKYVITDHALDEADDDDLLVEDIVDVLLNGEVDSTYTDDPRGPRYVIRGDIEDTEVDVVCRFRSDGTLLIIITVYGLD